MAKRIGREFRRAVYTGKRQLRRVKRMRWVYPNPPSKRGRYLQVHYGGRWQTMREFGRYED